MMRGVLLAAIEAGGSAERAAVWSHADDVTYMGPDGTIRVGWDQVRASWRRRQR